MTVDLINEILRSVGLESLREGAAGEEELPEAKVSQK